MGCNAPQWTLPPIPRPHCSLPLQFSATRCVATCISHPIGPNGLSSCHGTVRCIPNGGAITATAPSPPFVVFGRDTSVFLETIKRGDLDVDGKEGHRTIVLRLYEAYGGHATVGLQIHVPGVVAAYETNLLEDDAGAEALTLEQTTGEGEVQRQSIRLAFRGFEVKTVKLVVK